MILAAKALIESNPNPTEVRSSRCAVGHSRSGDRIHPTGPRRIACGSDAAWREVLPVEPAFVEPLVAIDQDPDMGAVNVMLDSAAAVASRRPESRGARNPSRRQVRAEGGRRQARQREARVRR